MTSESMIEKMARTLCSVSGRGGVCDRVGDDFGCMNGKGEQLYADGCKASADQLRLSGDMKRAHAVLAVMYDPTPGMLAAAYRNNHPRDEETWCAMIQAAQEGK